MSDLSGEQMDDLERVLEDADGHELFAIVAAVHHERIGHPLHDGALGLAEPFGRVTAGAVRQKLGVLFLDGQVVLKKES